MVVANRGHVKADPRTLADFLKRVRTAYVPADGG